MSTAETLIRLAESQLGVMESPAGSNKVKYNTWYYGKEVSGSAYPWCCVFLCWLFAQAGAPELIRRTGGCTTLMNWFKTRGQLVSAAQVRPGDIVFYQFDQDSYADHVGLVTAADAKTVTAIEGNTSLTSDHNGGAVMRRTRKKSLVMAAGRPDYRMEEEKDMTEGQVRAIVARAVEPRVYRTVEECPAWARGEVQEALDAGILKGDGSGSLELTDGDVKALLFALRAMKKGGIQNA